MGKNKANHIACSASELKDTQGKQNLSLFELYGSFDITPLFGFPPANLVTNEELKLLTITTNVTPMLRNLVVNPPKFRDWFAIDFAPKFVECSAGQQFEGAYLFTKQEEKVLVLVQDKVSAPDSSTSYSIKEIAKCCKTVMADESIRNLGVKVVIIWAAFRNQTTPETKTINQVKNMMANNTNISVLFLPKAHLQYLYSNFITE